MAFRTVPKKPPTTDTSTRKLFKLAWREDLTKKWDEVQVEATAFLVTPSGSLTLFLYKMPQHCISAGYWRDLTLMIPNLDLENARGESGEEE